MLSAGWRLKTPKQLVTYSKLWSVRYAAAFGKLSTPELSPRCASDSICGPGSLTSIPVKIPAGITYVMQILQSNGKKSSTSLSIPLTRKILCLTWKFLWTFLSLVLGKTNWPSRRSLSSEELQMKQHLYQFLKCWQWCWFCWLTGHLSESTCSRQDSYYTCLIQLLLTLLLLLYL